MGHPVYEQVIIFQSKKTQPNVLKCPSDNVVETSRSAIYRVSHQLVRRIN